MYITMILGNNGLGKVQKHIILTIIDNYRQSITQQSLEWWKNWMFVFLLQNRRTFYGYKIHLSGLEIFTINWKLAWVVLIFSKLWLLLFESYILLYSGVST